MRNVLTFLLISAAISGYSNIHFDKEVCGDLKYVRGSYVLSSDHGDTYIVKEEKLNIKSMELTTLMKNIVINHNYEESNFPRACFYDVKSFSFSANKFNVLIIQDVLPQEFIN